MLVTSNYFKDVPGKKSLVVFDIPVKVELNQRLKYKLHGLFFNKVEKRIVGKAIKLDRDIYLIQIENVKKARSFVSVKEQKSKKLTANTLVSDIDVDEEIMDKYKHYLVHSEYKVEKLYPSSRMGFLNEVQRRLLSIQKLRPDSEDSGDSCKSKDKGKSFELMMHQEIVKQYINSYTPYRGILLYHGLGSGKTCSSIALIEGMMTSKKIFIITPASLQENYRTQIKYCGEQIFRSDHHWEFEKINYATEYEKKEAFVKLTGITKKSIEFNKFVKENGGLWFITNEKKSNFNELSTAEQERINTQIEIMIRTKYHFVNYNGLTMKKWKEEYKKSLSINPFDDSTIIIDEAHNFINSVLNKINAKKTSVSTEVYEQIMDAENCRVILLTGTPYINYPSELGCLFNLINGYTKTVEVKVNALKSVLTQSYFENLFRHSETNPGMVDIIEYNQNNSVVRFVKNPYGFIKEPDGKMIYDQRGDIYMSQFSEFVVNKLKEQKDVLTVVNVNHSRFSKLPDNTKSFNELFVTNTNEMKLKPFFQRRIVGMVSYLGDKKELMPDMIKAIDKNGKESDIHMEYINMSPHQIDRYEAIRVSERKQEKIKKKPNDDKDAKSSYRVFSRSACNFSFPDDMPRPMPKKNQNVGKDGKTKGDFEIDEEMLDAVSEKELKTDGKLNIEDVTERETDIRSEINVDLYATEITEVLKKMYDDPSKYFETNIEKFIKSSATGQTTLDKYSPKFVNILKNMMDVNNQGCHLMYTNFRKLEGIGLFRIALLYHGYKEIKIEKNSNGDYIPKLTGMYDNNQYTDTKVFALYTGTESTEEREIIRKIYNNEHSKLPQTVRKGLSTLFPDLTDGNLYGDMIQLLMITASGAEGIDLKNVRFVHIMEPYWHHVRINQVIGRARRICSHASLPEEMQTVKVYMYISVIPEEILKTDRYVDLRNLDNGLTTDQNLNSIMEKKHNLSKMFLDSLKEVSVDCTVNYGKCFTINTTESNKTKLISDIDYRQAATGQVSSQAEVPDKKTEIVVRIFDADGEIMPFAVDEFKGIVYDYLQFKQSNGETKIRVGTITKDGKFVLDN